MSKTKTTTVEEETPTTEAPLLKSLEMIQKSHEDFKMAYGEAKAMAVSRAKLDHLFTNLQNEYKELANLVVKSVEDGFLNQELKDFAKAVKTQKNQKRLDAHLPEQVTPGVVH